jgi:hypothetical protein
LLSRLANRYHKHQRQKSPPVSAGFFYAQTQVKSGKVAQAILAPIIAIFLKKLALTVFKRKSFGKILQ